jgi:hypothetical protein
MAETIKANTAGRLTIVPNTRNAIPRGRIIKNVCRGTLSTSGSVAGYAQGISLGGQSAITGETYERHLQFSVSKTIAQGSPSSPALEMLYPGMFRFRWVVRPGQRTVSIRVKQPFNITPRPTLTLKSNASIGIPADIVATAGSSTDWITIGPITATVTTLGVVWVEMRNNLLNAYTPCYWDHIVVT